ncbi:extensin [Folsomia candida]|nr:extensin [Folsomia candida]
MKSFVVLASLCMLIGEISAQFGGMASYGLPPQQSAPSSGYGAPSGGQIHKHVFVHVAPDEPPEPRPSRPYKPPPPPEKHYKILFIKAPTPPPQEQQEIDLPPFPEQKTLVYVLLKKPPPVPEVKINPAPPTKPSKPEVYFIRYKNQEQGGYGAPQPPQSGYGSPSPAQPPSSQYGSSF